jgi:hypothetical protein
MLPLSLQHFKLSPPETMNDFLFGPPYHQVALPTRQQRGGKLILIETPELAGLDPKSFTYRARVALIMRRMTVAQVARAIGRSRVVTSQAINHGLHEPTRKLVAKHLGIAA